MVLLVSPGPPTAGIIFQESSVKAIINEKDIGLGDLYIAEEKLTWRPGAVDQASLLLDYPRISIHALQRDPLACLYLLIDYVIDLNETEDPASGQNGDDDEFNPEESTVTEIRFIPSDTNRLQEMYAAMSRGQQLHPDQCEGLSSDDEEEEYNNMAPFDEDAEDAFEDAEGDNVNGPPPPAQNGNNIEFQDADMGEEY